MQYTNQSFYSILNGRKYADWYVAYSRDSGSGYFYNVMWLRISAIVSRLIITETREPVVSRTLYIHC